EREGVAGAVAIHEDAAALVPNGVGFQHGAGPVFDGVGAQLAVVEPGPGGGLFGGVGAGGVGGLDGAGGLPAGGGPGGGDPPAAVTGAGGAVVVLGLQPVRGVVAEGVDVGGPVCRLGEHPADRHPGAGGPAGEGLGGVVVAFGDVAVVVV